MQNAIMLSVDMLNFIILCHNAECRFTEPHYVSLCHYAVFNTGIIWVLLYWVLLYW